MIIPLSMTDKFRALIEICRPLNVLLTSMVVIIAALIASDSESLNCFVWLAALSAGLVAGGGNVINDIYDLDVDKINKPKRPLPSGRISLKASFIWCRSLLISGVALAFSIQSGLGLIAFLVAILLWGYAKHWKGTVFLGNVIVAFCGALAFIFGALTVSNIADGIIPAIFAFLIHLGREIIKDIEDMDGDSALGLRTLPIVWGVEKSRYLAAGVLLTLCLVTVYPYFTNLYNELYMVSIIIGVLIPLMVMIVFLFFRIDMQALRRISMSLKIIMITGLLSLYLGKF